MRYDKHSVAVEQCKVSQIREARDLLSLPTASLPSDRGFCFLLPNSV